MKVLLINPPSNSLQPVMPLGLAYLAGALEKNNISVQIIDAWAERLDFKALEKRIHDVKYSDLIGITIMSPTYLDAVMTIQTVKKTSPKSKIVIGGTHPSSLPLECMEDNPEVDFAVAGEGDEVIVELVKAMGSEKNGFSNIKGLLYRRNGNIANNGHANPVKNLDNLPFPSRHLFPIFKYKTHPPYRLYNKYATMITSRGCPFDCTYCTKSVSGRNYRAQSAERVIQEIEFLIDKYNIMQIHFYDDDFTINMKRTEEICDKLIEKKIKITWSCITRVDLVSESLLVKMKKAGCWLIAYGVESGSQNILDSIKRGYKIEQVKRAFKLTRETGIKTLGYFIAGLPGESYSTLGDTIRLSISLNPNFVSWSIPALYPGSELYNEAVHGKLGKNFKKTQLRMNKDATGISSLSPYAQGNTYIFEGEIPKENILKIVHRAYRNFYFNPGYILKFLINLRTFTEFISYIQTFFQYLKWRKRLTSFPPKPLRNPDELYNQAQLPCRSI